MLEFFVGCSQREENLLIHLFDAYEYLQWENQFFVCALKANEKSTLMMK